VSHSGRGARTEVIPGADDLLARVNQWVVGQSTVLNQDILAGRRPRGDYPHGLQSGVLNHLLPAHSYSPREAQQLVVLLGLAGASVARHYQEEDPAHRGTPERAFDRLVVGRASEPFVHYFAQLADRTGTGHSHRDSYASLVRWNLPPAEVWWAGERLAMLPSAFDDGQVRSYTGTADELRFFGLLKASETLELAINQTIWPLSDGSVDLLGDDAAHRIGLASLLLDGLRQLNSDFAARPPEKGLRVDYFMDVFRQFAVHWTASDVPPSGALDAEALVRDLLLGIDLPEYPKLIRRVFPGLLDGERHKLAHLMTQRSLPRLLLDRLGIDSAGLAAASAEDLRALVVQHPSLAGVYLMLNAHARAAGVHLLLAKRFLFAPQRARDLAGGSDSGVVSNRIGTTGMDEARLEELTRARHRHSLSPLHHLPAHFLEAVAGLDRIRAEAPSGYTGLVRFVGTSAGDLSASNVLTIQAAVGMPLPPAPRSAEEAAGPEATAPLASPVALAGAATATPAPPPRGSQRKDRDERVGHAQLLSLIDNTSSVIYMRDLSGRYMLVNREFERLFDLRREEILGLTDHDLFPTAIADEFRANDLRAAVSGGPVQVEEIAPGEDGLHTYLTVKFPLIDSAGQPYAVCGISTDITQRKRAEEQVTALNLGLEQRVRERTAELEASNQELDAFAYSVSHDLRAPLRSLHGFSQVLIEDYADTLDETAVGYLHRLQANAVRMAQMIDDLLRLSRTTRVELRRATVDLAELANTIVEELRAAEPERIVDVSVLEGLTTSGDVHLLQLALHNLLANAWKFTANRPNARIELGCQTDGTEVVFFIRDNGAGFDPRYAKKLFEPFQRLHSAKDFDGSGIGLAIVSRVVRRHGGRIWAESTPDQGAVFFYTLSPPLKAEGDEDDSEQ
jgi:PAS domain S-box-containing protein